jgi:hypothetical protein
MGEKGEPVAAPLAGAIPAGGLASMIRIPVPGTDRLAIELSPRNYRGKSTSSLFIQSADGKRVLRLDYGFNVKTNRVDYHWNQKGTFSDFGIADHTGVGRSGASLYGFAKGFRHAGRVLVVVGAVADAVSIVQSDQPLRRATEVVTAWASAEVGAESLGELGAGIGTAIEPGVGTAVFGIVFAFAGGVAGYWAGEKVGAVVYDWGQANFRYLPVVSIGAMP